MTVKDPVKAPEKRLYEVVIDIKNGGSIAGRRRAKGEKVELTDSEAYFLELDGVIKRVEPVAPVAVKPAKTGAGEA